MKNYFRMFLAFTLAVAFCAPLQAQPAGPATPPPARRPAARPPIATGTTARPAAPGTVNITMAPIPLSTVVLYISEFTGKPVLPPELFPEERIVNVVSSSGAEVPQEKAIEIFAVALRNAGYVMIERPDYIQIVKEEATTSAPIHDGYPDNAFTSQTLLTKVVDIKNADAGSLAEILKGIKSKSGSVTVYKDLNKLIIKEQGSQLREILDLVSRLDIKWADNVTEHVKLEKASVGALSGVVGTYITNLAAGADPLVKQRLASFSSFAYTPTNSFVLFGNPLDIQRVREFIHTLDVSADPANRSYHTYFVLNRDVADMVKVLNDIFSAVKSRAGKDAPGETAPSVIPDPVNGAIIIVCSQDKYDEIQQLLKELDKPKAQVQIQAALVDMSTQRLVDLGVELASLDSAGENMRGFGGTSFGLSTVTAAGRTPILPTEGGLTTGLFKNHALNIGALMRLSQSDESVSFIAAPVIMASDNKPATITSKEMREYQKSIISPEGNTSEITGGSFNEASITLEITPHINAEGTVRLEIKQTTEQFLPSTETTDGTLLTNKTSRMAQTEVLVPEGTTVVIAGLTRTVQSKRVAKTPLLGDIPLLGFFFRRTTTTNEQRNLCVFITPTILRGADELAAQAQMRRNEMIENAGKVGIPMTPADAEVLGPVAADKGADANGK